jgi:hypothetical protein
VRPLLVEQLAVMNVFASGSAYDPAVNKLSDFTTVLYAEPAVQRLSPPAIDPMRDA